MTEEFSRYRPQPEYLPPSSEPPQTPPAEGAEDSGVTFASAVDLQARDAAMAGFGFEEEALHPVSRSRAVLKEIAETLLLALVIYLTVRAVVQNFKVEGSSMEPTLRHGEYLLVNKAAYMGVNPAEVVRLLPFANGADDGASFYPFGLPQRGDIAVFRYPRDPSRDFIKRVVAVPGETVEVRAGVVYVNDEKVEEPYILANPTYTRKPYVLPAGEFFVLGDNRANSSDSHVWGPVPMENIVGKAWFTYWPPADVGNVSDHSVLAGQ